MQRSAHPRRILPAVNAAARRPKQCSWRRYREYHDIQSDLPRFLPQQDRLREGPTSPPSTRDLRATHRNYRRPEELVESFQPPVVSHSPDHLVSYGFVLAGAFDAAPPPAFSLLL